MRARLAAVLVALVLVAPVLGTSAAVAAPAAADTPIAAETPIAVAPPVPPAPDAAALATLPRRPDALPGLAPLGACPAGIAPTGFDALGGDPDAVPGADARGVLVAVVDSGVAPHPRLAGGVTDGGDFVGGRSARTDCDGHGTAIAGVVAAVPGPDDGVVGIAPGARILAVRADSSWYRTADGADAGDEATLARAVRAAAEVPGVGVLTLALAACRPAAELVGGDSSALGALRAAVREAADRGIVVVAAAGNVDTSCPANDPAQADLRVVTVPAPAWFSDDVLTVGSLDDAGRPDPSSLAGPWVRLAASGRVPAALDARSAGLTADLTLPGSAPAPVFGTSFAAARVAGAAALLRARFPALPAREVVDRLVRTAAPVEGSPGALDVPAALAGTRPPPPGAAAPPPSSSGTPVALLVAAVVVVLAAAGVLVLRRTRRPR